MVDSSPAIFFADHSAEKIMAFNQTPITWWNFVFIEKNKVDGSVCKKLYDSLNKDLDLLICEKLYIGTAFSERWAKDVVFKLPAPSLKDYENQMRQTMIKAAFPLDEYQLQALRYDPFGTLTPVLLKFNSFYNLKTNMPTINTDLYQVAAMKFNYNPQDTNKTEKIKNKITTIFNNRSPVALGPHFGMYTNQSRIKQDLNVVGLVVFLCMLLLVFFLWYNSFAKLFWSVPIITSAILLATVVTVLLFSSIHGLTLAFGSALIGLSLDYIFHAYFASSSRIWGSILVCLLTTLISFALLFFIDVPLLKQLSVFSIVGLVSSFSFTYVIFRKHTENVNFFLFSPSVQKWWSFVFIGFMLLALCSFIFVPISLNMRNFEYFSDKSEIKFRRQIDAAKKNTGIYYTLDKDLNADKIDNYERVAKKNNAIFFHALEVTPGFEEATENKKSWKGLLCSEDYNFWKNSLAGNIKIFFEPMFNALRCDELSARPMFVLRGPKYFLSMWKMPANKLKVIKNDVPNIFSLPEIVNEFPTKVYNSLNIFFPSLLFVFVAGLLIYFRSFYAIVSGILPFISSLGFVFIIHMIQDISLSFIDLIGFLILIGISIDYGVIATSYYWRTKLTDDIWISLAFSLVTSFIGFMPLYFAQHPVLHELGETLLLGLFGIGLASYLFIPAWADWTGHRV